MPQPVIKFKNFTAFMIACFFLAGCGRSTAPQDSSVPKPASQDPAPIVAEKIIQEIKEKNFQPFIVYQDKGSRNRFVPSGYMPTGECLELNDAWTTDCIEGASCIRVVYDTACSQKSRQWAGIYWLNPADNWGNKKGGYNLSSASKLVFWAKGEHGGEQIAEFKIGGVGIGQDYPDSDSASIGPVILSKEWKEYSIDLRGKDLSFISGGFAWAANADSNREGCTFYLDHIRYEQ